jgi:hypothetical protein
MRPASYFTREQHLFTTDQMFTKLAERTGNPLKPPEAGQSPKAKSELEWEKPVTGSTGVKTKCGTYACAKLSVLGVTRYELRKRVGEDWTPINLRLDNFLQAQTLAQQDADKS